jgi:hypothetical protein
MHRSTQLLAVAALTFGAVALGSAAAFSESIEGLLRRYPYDPACLWGRLANGKGTVLRCLSEQEAAALGVGATAAPAAPAAAAPPAATGSAPVAPVEPGKAVRYEFTAGPVIADKGELGIGKLGAPKDRYAKCLEDNGGLRGETGEVHIRFLVRSKGIAEGVSVQKRVNLTPEAARCIAEVVDRRHVGVPEEPLVGATLQIKIVGRP